MLQSTQYDNFRIAILFCLLFVTSAALFLLVYGKVNAFLIINSHHTPELDFIFSYITWLGNGFIYLPVLLYCVLHNRKLILPVIWAIVLCTFFTQFLKRIVYPDELRPLSLETSQIIIHKVTGIYINRLHSFPSGHAGTAFSLAILLSMFARRKAWIFFLTTLAFLVAYSRVYLAQHFVFDVLTGMLVGILTAYLSLLFSMRFLKSPNHIKKLQAQASKASSTSVTAAHTG